MEATIVLKLVLIIQWVEIEIAPLPHPECDKYAFAPFIFQQPSMKWVCFVNKLQGLSSQIVIKLRLISPSKMGSNFKIKHQVLLWMWTFMKM